MSTFWSVCVALSFHYAMYRGVLQIQFETPGPGCYWVMETEDLCAWRVLACGCETNAVHGVAAVDTGKPQAFYTVQFKP